MIDPLRVAVIGAGHHAQSCFAMIRKEPDMVLTAVAEFNPETLEQARRMHEPEWVFTDDKVMLGIQRSGNSPVCEASSGGSSPAAVDERNSGQMMAVIVDTNIIIDVITDDPTWAKW